MSAHVSASLSQVDIISRELAALTHLEARIGFIARAVAGKIAFSTSLGVEDQVILHAIATTGAAIDVFTLRIAGEIARLAATLGGLDAIVFTAGIGENQPPVRAGVCARLQWLGIALDDTANAANALKISRNDSRIGVFVIPTDEEQVIADEGWSALAKS